MVVVRFCGSSVSVGLVGRGSVVHGSWLLVVLVVVVDRDWLGS